MALAVRGVSEFEHLGEQFPECDMHPYWGEFGRAYYPAVFEAARHDESFIVVDGDAPIMLVPCTRGGDVLDWFGLPIRVFVHVGLAAEPLAAAADVAVGHCRALAVAHGLTRVHLLDESSHGALSPLGEACLNRRATATLRLNAIATIAEGEAGLRRGLRKSFKSLLNWGRRNLETRIIGAANPDESLFSAYREFHRKIAGRVTRGADSWQAMFRWIAAGRGELILGYLDNALVTGTMVVDGNGVTAYASGAYDRERFDKPMAHWPLWLAMLRSAERKNRRFDLGDVPTGGDDKEYSIGYFKRGFATEIASAIEWTMAAGKAGA